MKIGLLGFDFTSPNKGCEALSYSFVSILKELSNAPLEVHAYGYSNLGLFPRQYPGIDFHFHRLNLKNPKYLIQLRREFSELDCIFDITFGDGFSDIYGKKWNAITDLSKEIANQSKAPFILLPQTYGPFDNIVLKKWAARIVRHSEIAFSRDQKSADEMNEYAGEKVKVTTDLAFALPCDREMFTMKSSRKLGLNVSSLLWDGGHNILLKTNYQKYCAYIIEHAYKLGFDEVHLIAHVIDNDHPESLENDFRICKLLHEKYPNTVLAPPFETPIEAKSYISHMTVFIGARMHSTIAAFSTGVCTIPFAYSKKFEGLFGNIDYHYIVDGRLLNLDEAVNLTEQYISDERKLRESQELAMTKVRANLEEFKSVLSAILADKK